MSKPRRNLMITTLMTSMACSGLTSSGDGLGAGPKAVSEVSKDERGCRQYWHDDCPEGASCNPPPPADVQCPPELQNPNDSIQFLNNNTCELQRNGVSEPIACPVITEIAETPPSKPSYVIARYADRCLGSFPSSCPPEAPCNPPAPDALACPPELQKEGDQLTLMDDGKCRVTPQCSPTATCPEWVSTPCPDIEALKSAARPQ